MPEPTSTMEATPPPKPKRALPFKRTIFRKQTNPSSDDVSPNGDDDGLSLFQRSKEFFPRAIEEAERERAQAHRTSERQATSPKAERSDPQRQDPKRRKLSAEREDSMGDIYGVSDEEEEKVKAKGPTTPSPKAARKLSGISPSQNISTPAKDVPARSSKSKGKEVLNPPNLYGDSPSRPVKRPAATASLSDDDTDEPATRSGAGTRLGHDFEAPGKSSAVVLDDDDDDDDDDDLMMLEDAEDGEVAKEVEDPEFEKYIIRARERDAVAKAAAAATAAAARTSPNSQPTSELNSPDHSFGTPTGADVLASSNIIYNIYVTSRIPGVDKPMLFTRRLCQTMRLVRDTWVVWARREGKLSAAQAEGLFFTWRGNKIYNTTTGMSLQLHPDASGKLHLPRSSSGRAGVTMSVTNLGELSALEGLYRGGLHLEAWTEDLYADFQREREEQRQRDLAGAYEMVYLKDDHNNYYGADAEGGVDADEAEAAQEASKIRVILKSRDHDPLKSTAHPDTTIGTLEAAFRKQRGIEPHRQVALYWDGERLDPDSTVRDAEIEDMETVEVHIK